MKKILLGIGAALVVAAAAFAVTTSASAAPIDPGRHSVATGVDTSIGLSLDRAAPRSAPTAIRVYYALDDLAPASIAPLYLARPAVRAGPDAALRSSDRVTSPTFGLAFARTGIGVAPSG